MKTITTLFVLLTIFSLNTFAQNVPYTVLEGHWNSVYIVAFSPDGKILASGDDGGYIRLWDATTGEHIRRFRGHRDVRVVAFSPDGKILASASSLDRTVILWDATTGREIDTLTGHWDDVMAVAFSPDEKILASASEDQTVILWDATTSEHIRTLNTGFVTAVAFSPDGKILASGSEDGTHLWDATTGEHIRTLNTGFVRAVAFSPDGKILASGSEDGTHLWDATTGKLIHTLAEPIGDINYNSMAFSPDGKILAGNLYRVIRLWDATTGELIHTLSGHKDNVKAVAFSPDGKILASGSKDRTVRLWRMPSTHVNITPDPVVSPAIGEQFTIGVSVVAGENIGGYQISLKSDATALRYIESSNGDYLPPGAFFVPPVVSSVENAVTLGATSLSGVSEGDGMLATVTFEVIEVKESIIELFDIILTDSDGEHLPHLAYSAVVEPSLLPTSAIISITPSSILSPAVGEQLTFNVEIAGGQNVADYQLTYDFDESVLKYISKSRGSYLAGGVGNGDGMLETVTFEVLDVKASTVSVSGSLVAPNGLRSTPTFESAKVLVPLLGDVNRDGVVNILDLVQVASKFGQKVSSDPADVNEDGLVNIVDLVKVAGALGDGAAAPLAWHLSPEIVPARANVQKWLSQARQLNLTDATAQRGILFLENLLAALTPKETALLANYPNPFNPETWIPYQLAEPADVILTIYAVDGTAVRTLALGHQSIGIYQGKSRAAYWDGKNALSEPVASGVYFYTLKAGEFTATRKMLIRK